MAERLLNKIAQSANFRSKSSSPLDLDGARPVPPLLTRKIEDLEYMVKHGSPFSMSDLPAFIDAAKNLSTVGLDDRKFLLEKLLVVMSRLPKDSTFSNVLQTTFVSLLYKDLPHPPSGYLSLPKPVTSPTDRITGTGVQYAFRSANGVDYNPLIPSLGQAGFPYARSVPSTNFTPLSALPDSGLVFDTLLKRDGFVKHPGGLSNVFFAFADLVIHSIFNTDHTDYTVNNTSSYLDLSILYGNSDSDVQRIKRNDGTGKLWDDVFADPRLLTMPPSVCALTVLLSRNHNFIAEKILNINERGNLSNPPPTDVTKRQAQDDEIFQRARLVNCGHFMKMILVDYVGAILGLDRDGIPWRLDPLSTFRMIDHEFAPQGQGNVCSIEFNLLYRWHAAISEQDEEWTKAEFAKIFSGKDYSTITPYEFIKAFDQLAPPADVQTWSFGGLTRDANGRGKFNDGDLANILQSATERPAAAFRARGIPEVLRVVEILGIEQARRWGACSLNEFRAFLGLRAYETFEEWNPDPTIHKAAAALYGSIDNLELHVGLQAEEAKPAIPGSGICPGYTISRSILADAVCLTRGDRFLTIDFTPFNLTSWGYQDCMDVGVGSAGGMMTKLLYRNLPDYYPAGSAYAHYPMLTPDFMKTALEKVADSPVNKYMWSRPSIPQSLIVLSTYEAVTKVLQEKESFTSVYTQHLVNISKGVPFDPTFVKDILFADSQMRSWRDIFRRTTGDLIREKSVDHVGSAAKYIDIVKDVINILPIHWICEQITGVDLKSEGNPKGVYREQELYDVFAEVCNYVYLDFETEYDWKLRENSLAGADLVIHRVKEQLSSRPAGFLKTLLDAGKKRSPEELATSLFATVVPSAAQFSQVITHVVDFYLSESQGAARQDIIHLSPIDTQEARDKVMVYINEALRLNPFVAGVYRTSKVATDITGNQIKPGERIFASIVEANLDPQVFGPDPSVPNFNRSPEASVFLSLGENGLLSSQFFAKIAPEVLGVIFSLKDMKRGPRNSGKLNSFDQKLHGTTRKMYINLRGETTPFPPSLVLQYST